MNLSVFKHNIPTRKISFNYYLFCVLFNLILKIIIHFYELMDINFKNQHLRKTMSIK